MAAASINMPAFACGYDLYPTALKLKRELANLMIDYRIDYNAGDDLPEGTYMSPEAQPIPKRPSFLQPDTGDGR
jgi:hypothetical protein